MSVKQVPGKTARHEGAVEARLDAEQPVDVGGAIIFVLAQTDQELTKLKAIAGLHRGIGSSVLGRVGAIIAKRGLNRGRQKRIIFVKQVGLARARGQLHWEMPARRKSFGGG